MAESMLGLKRSHRCTEVTTANIGQEVTVMGWVQKSRNKGGIIFVDLRDRSGILQIIFEESDCGAESFAKAEKLRSEYVIAVTGRVEARSAQSTRIWRPVPLRCAPTACAFYLNPRLRHFRSRRTPRPKRSCV